MVNLPGYRLIRKLGSGGMAIVYLAEHEKLGHRVAIKVLSDVLTHDPMVRKRFLQEARLMASLKHQGIIAVTDYIETESTLAIVMEYVEGRTLDMIIGHDVGPIPAEKAIPLFRQLLEATAYAHRKGIVHRDLKPSNAIITSDARVKLGDFGIAKIAGSATKTRTGTKLGTLFYMSPEQIRGAKDIDRRADVYSLGMTLYEMLAGNLPFDTGADTSEFDIAQKIVFEEFEPPDTHYPHIPKQLVEIVRKATAKKPEDRFQNCEEFIKALDSGKISKPIHTKQERKPTSLPPSPSPPSTKSIVPNTTGDDSGYVQRRAQKGRVSKWFFIATLVVLAAIVTLIALLGAQDPAPVPTGMEFVTIPSGSFMMGSPTSESNRNSDEERHSVSVSSFELMTTEVTQGMWEEVMGTSVDEMRSRSDYEFGLVGSGSNYPMYYVSWRDCQDFIDELNDLDPNHTYRLPTEAEWEYACRAGTTTAYYWGSSMNGSYCWYRDNSNGRSHPVGTKQPNYWGLYDMSGNVWEWCQDVYTSDYDDCPTDGSAYTGSGSLRVVRGGSWLDLAPGCRSAVRYGFSPGSGFYGLGFRLARSAS